MSTELPVIVAENGAAFLLGVAVCLATRGYYARLRRTPKASATGPSRSWRAVMLAGPGLWLLLWAAPVVVDPELGIFICGRWWLQGIMIATTCSMGCSWRRTLDQWRQEARHRCPT